MLTIELTCPFCHADHSVEMDYRDFVAWQNGELIQNVAPYLSATEREQLISRLCPKCQEEVFGADEDEGWDDEPDDIDSDMGYDPYAGCFTDDC